MFGGIYNELWKQVLVAYNFTDILPRLKKITSLEDLENFLDDNVPELASSILASGTDILPKEDGLYCESCGEGLIHEPYPTGFYDDSCVQEAESILKSAWFDLHYNNPYKSFNV